MESNYRKVGATIIIGIILLALLAVLLPQNSWFTNKHRYFLRADNVSDISLETPIIISGYEIGQIKGYGLKGKQVVMELSISKAIKLGSNSTFIVKHRGSFGDRVIEAVNTTDGAFIYTNGDTILGALSVSNHGIQLDSVTTSGLESTLKALSKEIGTHLVEYGTSNDSFQVLKDR